MFIEKTYPRDRRAI